VTFKFNSEKATEAAYQFIQREGGQLNLMKLVKLVYLLDRLSLARRGIPVVGGAYLSMKNGPVISEVLDLLNSGKLADEESSSWEKMISGRRDDYTVTSKVEEAPVFHLSESELMLIDDIYKQHGAKDQWQLRDWCHENCGEWTPLTGGRATITLSDIGKNVGKSDSEIEQICEEAKESSFLDSIFCASRHG